MHEDRKAIELHAARAPLLVAAVSGRALAASARRGGFPVVVLDYFADRDCAASAVACRSVAAAGALRFDRRALLAAAWELIPSAQCAGVVYGSGFESRPTLLRDLAAGRRLYGNRPDVIRAVKDPLRLAGLLEDLAVPHPETSVAPPANPRGWLLKRIGGAGGTHVRPAGDGAPPAKSYFQRIEPGQCCSVLFLADGRRARILGWNRQWTSRAIPGVPYLFGGAVGGIRLTSALTREIALAVERLVAATGLIGINGLDFVVQGRRWSALEVNPRPTATLELYDPDYPRGLMAWHLAACDGLLPEHVPAPRASRALSIVHAPGEWTPGDFAFPAWCRDLPGVTASLGAGDPVCTVHASAAEPDAAVQLVERRRARLETMIARSRPTVAA
ncbi:MAG TPA: ATP-grasp domain-containing protein [Gemmatimonadales bacterium]|nr:ATP-grasp domain-containing protein [Gemmatimonadales bacterium]